MIKQIEKILKSKHVQYLINELQESSYELFFVNSELQMNRIKDVHHYKVTVYLSHDGYIGSASFGIHPTMSKEEINKVVEEGIYAAQFISNKPFELAKPEEITQVIEKSNMVGKDYEELGVSITEAILKADRHGGILNATEVFIYDRKVDVYNSNGVHYSKSNVSGEVEFITTQKGKQEEVELYNFKSIAELDLDALTKSVEEALIDTKLRAEAEEMPSLENIDVKFRVEEIKELMGYFLAKCNVGSIFARQSMNKIGDQLQGEEITGDKITLTIDPLLKSSPASSPFDNDCFVNNKTVIVKDGVFNAYWGSRIIAQYLGVESKVSSTNMVFELGSLKDSELENQRYIDIIKMSGIQVDSQTGSFGGEIRLAVIHDGDKQFPVYGGSISGFIKDYAPTMRISNEEVIEDNYQGPKCILFKGCTILGK